MNESKTPLNPFGIVPLSKFVPRGFGFVHHSIALLCHEVQTLISRFANFFIAVRGRHGDPPPAAAASLLAGGSSQAEVESRHTPNPAAAAQRRAGPATVERERGR
jgi:hypothetical protein